MIFLSPIPLHASGSLPASQTPSSEFSKNGRTISGAMKAPILKVKWCSWMIEADFVDPQILRIMTC